MSNNGKIAIGVIFVLMFGFWLGAFWGKSVGLNLFQRQAVFHNFGHYVVEAEPPHKIVFQWRANDDAFRTIEFTERDGE